MQITQKSKTDICDNIKKYFNIVECDMLYVVDPCGFITFATFDLICADTNIKPPFTEEHKFKVIDFEYIEGTFKLVASHSESWINHPLANYIEFLLNGDIK